MSDGPSASTGEQGPAPAGEAPAGGSGDRTVLERHGTALFVVLTFGLSWGWWAVAYAVGGGSLSRGLAIPGAFGPPAAAVLLTWCYNGTGGSVLLAMLLHGAVNASGNLLPAPLEAIERFPLAVDAGLVVAARTAGRLTGGT